MVVEDEKAILHRVRRRALIALPFVLGAQIAGIVFVLNRGLLSSTQWSLIAGSSFIVLAGIISFVIGGYPPTPKYQRFKRLFLLNPTATCFFLGVVILTKADPSRTMLGLANRAAMFGVVVSVALSLFIGRRFVKEESHE